MQCTNPEHRTFFLCLLPLSHLRRESVLIWLSHYCQNLFLFMLPKEELFWLWPLHELSSTTNHMAEMSISHNLRLCSYRQQHCMKKTTLSPGNYVHVQLNFKCVLLEMWFCWIRFSLSIIPVQIQCKVWHKSWTWVNFCHNAMQVVLHLSFNHAWYDRLITIFCKRFFCSWSFH